MTSVYSSDVTQMDSGRVVVAVSSCAVFESGAGDDDNKNDEGDVYEAGPAFPLLQALQRTNQRLLEDDPAASLLFDVALVTTNRRLQHQSTRIISSATHYGLEVGRFCFSSEEDFIESLLMNKVQLFLSTDRTEVLQASQKGVLSVLLDQQTASCPSEQLRVLLCGDTVLLPDVPAQSFLAQLGVMRRRFGMLDSPLSIVLVMSHGGRESCGAALLALRSLGISVDEAYCLAGAPKSLILPLLRHHFYLSDDLK